MAKENVIFGTHSTDDLRLLSYRVPLQGLQHSSEIEPRDPVPGEPVTVKVRVGPDLAVEQIVCFFSTDGTPPSPEGQSVELRRTALAWDALVWGYVERWQGDLPPLDAGSLVHYRVGARLRDGSWVFADWPDPEMTIITETRRRFGDAAAAALPSDPAGRLFAYTVDMLSPPDWARDAVLYHIFVDRFAPGEGRAFEQPDGLGGIFGGTLRGIVERLDYVAELGANTLWLSPIFPSPTHHGYDATDYRAVEPRLGTMDDLRLLLDEAHARGMRVLLDLALNHCSDQHPLFQEALQDPESSYRAWFHFDSHAPNGYRSYFGVPSMPEWNLAHPQVRRYLIDVGRFWMRAGVDGFRLDYADGPGPGFWSEFRVACREINPLCWLFGEIVQPPDVLAPFVGRLDGTLDFLWTQMMRRVVAHGNGTASDLARFLERHLEAALDNYLRPVFLDNHDMDRFLLVAGSDLGRLRLGLLLLLTWPQPPVIFYGTEVALVQPQSGREPGQGLEASRMPMVWDSESQDLALHEDVHALLALRAAHPALAQGRHRTEEADEGLWVFAREGADDTFMIALNLSEEPRAVVLPPGAKLRWSSAPPDSGAGLPALAGAIWQVRR